MKINAKHIVLFFTILSLSCTNVFSQNVPRKVAKGEEAWRYLNQAKSYYLKNDLSNSFTMAEKSKQVRLQESEWQLYILENVLRKPKIRKVGDKLNAIILELEKSEGYEEAISVINFHVEKKGNEYFSNSFSKLIEYVEHYSNYPEADYLISQIYKTEGEYQVSLQYMEKAYQYSYYLDIFEEKYDILYDLAELSKDLGNEDDYEKYLLLIAKDNEYFSNKLHVDSIVNLVNDKKNSVDKFFLLYRCTDTTGLKALILLNEYYAEKGYFDKALQTSAVASIIAVSRLDEVFKDRLFDYKYTNFVDILVLSSKYTDVIEWGNEENVWRLFCDLAKNAQMNNKLVFARDLYWTLSEYEPEEYWKKVAKSNLIQ